MDTTNLLEALGPIYGVEAVVWWHNPFVLATIFFVCFLLCVVAIVFVRYRRLVWHDRCTWSFYEYVSGLLVQVQRSDASVSAVYAGAGVCVKYFFEYAYKMPVRSLTDREFLLFLEKQKLVSSPLVACFERACQVKFAGAIFDKSVVVSDLQVIKSFLREHAEAFRT